MWIWFSLLSVYCGQLLQHYIVNERVWGYWVWQTICYFLTSVARSYFRFVSGCIHWLAVSVVGLAAQNLRHKSLPVFLLPVRILFPVCILLPVYTHTSVAPRSWPGYHGRRRSCTSTGHGGYRSGFPGRRNGTRLAGQVGATYVTVWIWVHFYYRKLLTNYLLT